MFIFAPSLILKTAPKILKKRELGKLFVLKRRNEPRGMFPHGKLAMPAQG